MDVFGYVPASDVHAALVTARQAVEAVLVIDERGGVVIPARLWQRLDLRTGTRLIATIDADNAIHVVLAREQARRLFGHYHYLAPDRSLIDELLAERRSEVNTSGDV